ncbi:MAG: VWA domain-containing protein [Pyrinomonadaceae bacterium]
MSSSITTRPILFLLSILLLSSAVFSQPPTPTPDADDVVKITTKLVQVDVVVTDKKGSQVRDLRASDFELLQDGKVQKIVGFTYVAVDSKSVSNTIERTPQEKGRPSTVIPPARLAPGDVGRVIAVMVDDGACGASLWGINSSRDGVKRFINEQMLTTDMVAIYRTRAGSSTFQQYTSDKAVLMKAAEKIRWYPGQGGCGNADGSFTEAAKANTYTTTSAEGTKTITIESDAEKKSREYREDSIRNNQVVGTLGVIRYALRGLEQAPGRKLMFLLSDGLAFRSRQNETLSARDAMRDVTDAANRAGVVVNTFDLRAANVSGMIEAKDEVHVRDNFNATEPISQGRMRDARLAQEGLAVLAYDTGGEFYQGSDRLNVPMGEILRRETGYYLLAYEPGDESFKDKRFNKIEVKLNVPDLKVAYRAGFTGVVDAEAKPKRRSGDSELYEAIASPLPRPGLALRLSAWFANTPGQGSFVRSVFHVDGADLAFTDAGDGQKKAVFDVVAVAMNEKNEVVDEFTRTHTLKFDPETAKLVNRFGLVYSADVPIKKPGAYNFRMAIRDGASKLIGSASQVVEIPDLKKSPLFLSAVTISGVDAAGKFETPAESSAQNAIALPASPGVPAIRRFRRGSIVAYSYSAYNAKLDRANGQPNLTIQTNLYKDGQLVVEGQPQPVDAKGQKDLARISDFAYMRLNTSTEPGDYALQITVRDLAGGKDAVSSQWVDFEVID